MDVIALVKEGFQSVAEHAASYKLGQTVLRHIDKALWVVEKCARWAVPPPLDPEERPQPELVRPLPWVFFLMMLVALRVTRESISLVNLVLGKPPLRSADVVTYIQGKRRYLRTLKYQGNRMMRARIGTTREPWYTGLRSLFEFTMCFKRQSVHYGNNNTTRVSNNDEVLVVKRSKRPRQPESATASTSETCMERLIEKMMVDLDAESDDDSSYTLTNATSVKSDRSETVESDQESTPNEEPAPAPSVKSDQNESPMPEPQYATPEPQQATPKAQQATPEAQQATPKAQQATPEAQQATPEPQHAKPEPQHAKTEPQHATPDNHDINNQTLTKAAIETKQTQNSEETALNAVPQRRSPMLDSEAFLQSERHPRSPKKQQKIANGRTVKSTSERNIGGERRDAAVPRAASADFSTRGRKENLKQTP